VTPPGLDALLQALRAAGLPMGPREVTRLHHVFALRPGLGQARHETEQLRDLLASALTHDPDERELFDQIYRPWAERWADWERPVEQRRITDPALPFAPSADLPGDVEDRPRWRTGPIVLLGVAAVAVLAFLWLAKAPQKTVPEKQEAVVSEGEATKVNAVLGTYTLWLAPPGTRVETPPQPWRPSWPPLIFGVLALAAAGGLFRRYGREPWMPTVKPEPLPGPAVLPLLPLAESGPELSAAV
jgi:hypothetical protein